MEFISSHNRNDYPGYEYSITSYLGLGHFNDSETINFLMNDFENLLAKNDTIESNKLEAWINAYVEVFKDLKYEEARPLIYQSLFKWFGLNADFAQHPELFKVKANLEDSINNYSKEILSEYKVEDIQS